MPGFTRNDVDSENRVRVPASLGPLRLEKQPVSFVPLVWHRQLLVDAEEEFHAWLLCHLDDESKQQTEWLVSPYELRDYDGPDAEKLHMSALIASVGRPTSYGKGGLRIQIPEQIRSMGWLPERNMEIVVLSDAAGVSVWRPEAFDKHTTALNRLWTGRGSRNRPAGAQIA
ncbi:MAG: hypothetical protein OEM98_07380 [Gammaproteobacteria bacterium]|nr:hypothetical protein [Gammaproteobacteria bacterium]